MSSNTKMDNNKIEKQAPQNKSNPDFNQNKKDLLANIKSIQNILDKKLTTTTLKVINKEISQNLKEINSLINKIINDKEKENNNIKHYESILKKNENTIRGLYGDLLHEKLLKEILEEKIILLLQMQNEYELVKEKTGVIVCDGKIICNERKDNEIMILRTENSTLKNVINEKEKEINVLKEKIEILKHDIIKLKKNKTNINININNPHTTSKKEANKFITISRSKEKQVLFNTIYSPGYSSQKEITINNFSSSTKNFYKSYHMNTNIINNNINNNNNKSVDKSVDKSSNNNKDIIININSQDNTIIPSEKLISVNKNKYNNNQKNSRNKNFYTNNYSSCENILNENHNKYKIKSNRNSKNNLVIKKSNEKKISRKALFSPLQEYNSVKYINSFSNNKEGGGFIPRTNRDSHGVSHNLNKQNTNVNSLVASRYKNGNGNSNVNTKKNNNEKSNKKFNGQKTGYLKRKKIPIFRNDLPNKENYSVLFHRTYNENFGGDKKIK